MTPPVEPVGGAPSRPGTGEAGLLGVDATFVRLPPGRRYVWVPLDSRRATLSSLALYGAARRRGQVATWLTSLAVQVAGPRVLPFPRTRWQAPVAPELWAQLCADWGDALPFHDGLAVYERPQDSRSGFGLLLLDHGAPVSFVKVRQGEDALSQEVHVLGALSAASVPGLRTPGTLAAGSRDDWSWLALEPLPDRGRLPRHSADVTDLVRAVQPVLGACLGDRGGAPAHWEPVHGDLTTWNTRYDRHGDLWVFDWEDARWGPPDADGTYYRATRAVMFGTEPGTSTGETVRWWLEQVEARSARDDDVLFNTRLAAVLRRMAEPAA